MLIENRSVVKDTIVSLKMGNGDELIGKFVEEQAEMAATYIVISKPMLMVLTQDNKTGYPGVQMVPFFMLGGDKDGKYPINKGHVVCMVVSNDEARKGYVQITSNITIATPTEAGKLKL